MTSDAPTVSVLMPVRSPHPEYFPAAVRAVLGQSLADLELIISESPGETSAAAMLEQFDDPRIRHHVLGADVVLVDQRNHGLAEARADIVALADGDDVCDPERLEKQVAFLRDHPDVDLVSCQLRVIDERGVDIGYRRYPTSHEQLVRAMEIYNPIAQPGITFRKQVVLDAGGYQYRKFVVNSDYELWSRLAGRGARFAVHPEALVSYRIHGGAIKTSRLAEVIEATIDIKRTYWLEHMSLKGKLRLAAEHALRWLPPGAVLALFKRVQFTRRPPG